tara:strand:- start:2850 stop:2978 length:129 start_codon:yes stop_codon:yes gene_type:complete
MDCKLADEATSAGHDTPMAAPAESAEDGNYYWIKLPLPLITY